MALGKFDSNKFVVSTIMILILAVFMLWLFSQFFAVNPNAVDPETGNTYTAITWITTANYGAIALIAMKFLLVFGSVFLAYVLITKISGDGFSKKDALTLILLGVALWFLWDKILVNVFKIPSLNTLGSSGLMSIVGP